MSEAKLIASLYQYSQSFPSENKLTQQFIHFVKNQPDCFARSLTIGHITASAWLMDNTGTQVLLTHHRKLNKWLQLGGHADGEKDVIKVSHTEAAEESGLTDLALVSTALFDIDIHQIPAFGHEPEHLHYDLRFCWQALGRQDFIVSDESKALAWVPLTNINDYTNEPSLLRMVKKWGLLTAGLKQAGTSLQYIDPTRLPK